MKIGVLALQGCVEPHRLHIERLGAVFQTIRRVEDCEGVSAYIIPGGESTVMLKLIRVNNLHDRLCEEWAVKPVWGICAGAILISKKVEPMQFSYGLVDCAVSRNAYGAQVHSFYNDIAGYRVAFIRAPKVTELGDDVEVMAEHNGCPVWIRNSNHMVTTFHPELNFDSPSPMHKYFINNMNK